jgi:hypothetical protein
MDHHSTADAFSLIASAEIRAGACALAYTHAGCRYPLSDRSMTKRFTLLLVITAIALAGAVIFV